MRKPVAAFVVVGIVGLAAAGAAGGDHSARPVGVAAAPAAGGEHSARWVSVTRRQASVAGRWVSFSGGLSVRVPFGWHVLHGWLSDVLDPAPRLAIASFPARLSRHTCECGFPNVVDFPRNGAFIFVWEYLEHFSRRALARTPSRPARFQLTGGGNVRQTCVQTSDTFAFKQAGRVFQVEVYLGPKAGPALVARTAAALDSLRVAPNA